MMYDCFIDEKIKMWADFDEMIESMFWGFDVVQLCCDKNQHKSD